MFTADELLRLPDHNTRHELVRGELRTRPFAGARNGSIAASIMSSLANFVQDHRLGEIYIADTGFILARDPDTVRAPNIAFVRTERVVSGDDYFVGAPDLAIEVVLPTDQYSEIAEKTSEYLNAGARAVVLVDPKYSSVVVHRATTIVKATDTLEVDDVVPGWKMPLTDIFAD